MANTDNRNYLKLAGYLVAIGGAAITINWIYQHFIEEWNKKGISNIGNITVYKQGKQNRS
jgi:hypothetical protein